MAVLGLDAENEGMNAADRYQDPGAGLLASLEESLQVLSGAWYGLAADAGRFAERRRCPDAAPRPENGVPSREREVRLMGTLHDVAAAFARCARVCRNARSTILSTAGLEVVPG
jgi:hypothetical protein